MKLEEYEPVDGLTYQLHKRMLDLKETCSDEPEPGTYETFLKDINCTEDKIVSLIENRSKYAIYDIESEINSIRMDYFDAHPELYYKYYDPDFAGRMSGGIIPIENVSLHSDRSQG